MSAFLMTTSEKEWVYMTVCSAMARASMQQDPIQPGCCLSLVGEQVWAESRQFQLRSASYLLNVLNLGLLLQQDQQYSWLSCCPLAKKTTLSAGDLNSSQTRRMVALPSVEGSLLMSQIMIFPINRAHSYAYNPLCVVKLCLPEQSTPSSKSWEYATGTGANLIKEPFPLLNLSPSFVYYLCSCMNSYIEMEMFPPRPIEQGLPPLLSPCYSHKMNRYRMWAGLKIKSLRRMLSAMQRPIEASSVHTAVFPERFRDFRSEKPCFTTPSPSLRKCWNSVQEPKASPMPMPKTAPAPRDSLKESPNLEGENSLLSCISWKMAVNLSRSSSFWGTMLCTRQHWFMLCCMAGLEKYVSMSHIIFPRKPTPAQEEVCMQACLRLYRGLIWFGDLGDSSQSSLLGCGGT